MLRTGRLTFPQLAIFSLPILLGLGLGFLIVKGNWVYALALAMMAPLVILFSQRPFIGVILWLVLMPLSSALPNPELMYWAIHRILIPFTLVMTLLPYLFKGDKLLRFRIGLPEICIALLAIYIPLSTYISGTTMNEPMRKYLDRMLIPFCAYLIFRFSNIRSFEHHLLQWSMFIVVASQCIIGFLSFSVPHYLPYAWRPLLQGYTAGSLLNPNVFASVLGFCICLLFQVAMVRKKGLLRYIFIIACGISLLGIFLSMERAAWLAGAVILLGLFGLYPKIMLRFFLVTSILLFVLGEILFSNYANRVADRIGNQGTIDDRIVVTNAMIQMIQAKPILGWGYDALDNHIEDYYRQVGDASANIRFTTSHNTYLTVFTDLGLVGFILYILPVVWLAITSLSVIPSLPRIERDHYLLLCTLWLGILQSFIICSFMDMRFFPIGLTFWWMTLGWIANLLNQHADTRDKYLADKSAQNWRQVQPFNQLYLENNGTKRQ